MLKTTNCASPPKSEIAPNQQQKATDLTATSGYAC
jgi:hypothetical protein